MPQTRRWSFIALGLSALLHTGAAGQAAAVPNLVRNPASIHSNPEVDSMTTSSRIEAAAAPVQAPLDGAALERARQLVVFEAEDCSACKRFESEVLDQWQSPVAVARRLSADAPSGWMLDKPLSVTPTLVLFEDGREVARYTGYDGDAARFWAWLGGRILTPEQRRIAFEQGTEWAFTGSLLDEKRPGVFVDPITGAPLFRSETKFDSGSGWPSFFAPVAGAITFHEDVSHGMRRVEVRSASSGIHLGHVFEDGPPPTRKRYCINSRVLGFVPDP